MSEAIKRLPEWQPRLDEYVRAHIDAQSFSIGTNDCATFAFGAVCAMIGYDPVADYRNYSTLVEAHRAALREGHGSMAEKATSIMSNLGMIHLPIILAMDGDVAVCADKKEPGMCVRYKNQWITKRRDVVGIGPVSPVISSIWRVI